MEGGSRPCFPLIRLERTTGETLNERSGNIHTVQQTSSELLWRALLGLESRVVIPYHTTLLKYLAVAYFRTLRTKWHIWFLFFCFWNVKVVAPVKFWFCFALFELSVAWFALKLNMLSASINVLQMFLRSLPPRYNLNSTDLLALFCDAQMNYPSLLPTQNWRSVSLNCWILEACF